MVLPNARAAVALRSAFDRVQNDRGLAAWEPARVFAWTQWTSGLWNELIVRGAETRLLLNEAQEHSLWKEIVSGATDTLATSDSLADLARSAFRLAATYNAIPRLRSSANTHDSRAFADWTDAFLKRCAAQNLLSESLLHEALRVHLLKQTLVAPTELHLVGFADAPPSQQAFVEALESSGTRIVSYAPMSASGTGAIRALVRAKDHREEFTTAARWIRAFLGQADLPVRSVAVLLPDLGEERAHVEAMFREQIAPELQSIHEDLSSTPWEFSSGVALNTLPLVQTAVALAQWAATPLPLERISGLLLSPYVGVAQDRDVAAVFDAQVLRRFKPLRPEASLAGLLERSSRHLNTPAPEWLRQLQRFLSSVDLTAARTFADWTDLLRALTQRAHWPGPRTLSALEFAATQAFDHALDSVATLDFAGRRVTFFTALQALDRQLAATRFSPPATHAPIQVMTPEESIGSHFDAVVFLNATDSLWPGSAKPHPLLAWSLQRSLQMPGTDATLHYKQAAQFAEDLLKRSTHSIFFAAEEDANGKLRPSPIVLSLGLDELEANELIAAQPEVTPLTLVSIPDTTSLPALPSAHIKGGSRVLQLQAACGFRAFAEFRLQAQELDDFILGLDAPASGARIHQALSNFWREVRTQDALRRMPLEERYRLLRQAVDEAISLHLSLENTWDEAYIALQTQRMNTVLQQWLEVELQRGPFSILTSEHKEDVTIGPLTLELRFDRIDKVDGDEPGSSGFVLVDYKTGASGRPQDWFGERPDDPQLPLYALPYQAGELKGMAFGKVRTGEMKWLGLQAYEGVLPGSSVNQVVDLQELVEEWHEVLHRLALEFAEGRALVDPKDYPTTCAHCAQRLLCRLDPSSLLQASVDEAIEESDD